MSGFSRFLSPHTLAVIGGKEAERVIEQCNKLGFEGTIWPVHPTRETMGGRSCFRSVDELPSAPDAAYVAVNRERTIDIVEALRKMGAGGAVCYAAGFAEANGESAGSGDLQHRLVEAAADMPIIGPNCYGFINAPQRVALWPDQHGVQACDYGVAILTQSSNIAINLTMQQRGLPIAMVMTVGNQAQTGLSRLALEMIEDDSVTALGLHIEGLDDVGEFEQLALRARELKKPIVAIKVGQSEQAQAITLTHTASLSGADSVHAALFARLGIARVANLETFVETLKLFHCGGVLNGRELLSLSCSGGEASLMADAALGKDIDWKPFPESAVGELKSILGGMVTIANPLDYNTFVWGDWPVMTRLFEAALAPDFDLALLVMDFPRADRCDPADWKGATNAFVAAVKQTGARAAVVASLPECMPEDVTQHLMQVGVTPLCGLDAALAAAEAAAFVGKCWADPAPPKLLQTRPTKPNESLITLDEHAAKRELANAGLVVPKGMVVTDMAELEKAMTTLEWPLAVKALGIAHKTESGAVALDLNETADLVTAVQKMARLSNRFLVEEMAAHPLAELIVGVSRDPVVGLTLTLGAGGVLAELLNDTATLLLPASETDIRRALAGLKIGQLLNGYRNSDAADIDALIANILCIAGYAHSHSDTLEELDVNPLFATQFGSVAVDALIVKRKSK